MANTSMTNKCCCEIKKINSYGSLVSKTKHNYRLINVDNADPERMHFNEELIKDYEPKEIWDKNISLEERNKKVVDFNERFRNRIHELPYYKDHSVRSNGVLAYEICLSHSFQANVPLEEWKQANLKWLQDEFNVAPDGKNNVVSCVYHGDENNAHIHAIVIPIDENGKLNASRFTNGWSKMVQYQDRYGKAMEQFGLERGTHGSQMEHEQVRKFYADANKILASTPKPEPGESAQEYFDRFHKQLESMQATQYMKAKKECEERRRQADKYATEKYQSTKLQYAQELEKLQNQQLEIQMQRAQLKREKLAIEKQQENLKTQKENTYVELAEIKERLEIFKNEYSSEAQKIRFSENFIKNYNAFKKAAPEKAQQLDTLLSDMEQTGKEHSDIMQER